jgi:hypothetical protein
MKTASWIILALAGALTLIGSLTSASVAYVTGAERIGSVSLEELGAGRAEVVTSLRARRGTAAAYAAGFATLYLAIVLGPYRRRESWAWWALLAGTLAFASVALLRVPMLGTRSGAATAALTLGVSFLGLLLDVSRLKASPPS